MRFPGALLCLLAIASLPARAGSAKDLYRLGREAEQKGEISKAYLLYSQAAAAAPNNPIYWARSLALRRQAILESPPAAGGPPADPPGKDGGPTLLGEITDRDLEEARRPLPPEELRYPPDRKTIDLRGDSKRLFEDTARTCGLEVVFDGDYEAARPMKFRLEDVTCREALVALSAATGAFLAPLGPKLFMAVKDTPQKRQEAEPAVAMAFSIPEPVSIQDAQEMARAVQQAMEIAKFTVDSQRRMVLLRGPVSKVRPAQRVFTQLLRRRSQVVVEIEFLEVKRNSSLSYGMRLPTAFPLVSFGKFRNLMRSIPGGFSKFLTFGGGRSLLGIGVADAELFASMSRGTSRTLMKTTMRSVDGQPAQFHVGDKYPVITSGYYGPVTGSGDVYTPPPTFNFEDLGLVLKITPKVHDGREVSLEVESEFKVLTGKTLNGIPVISTRKFQSRTRLREGEWAVMAGLLSSSEAHTVSGIAGLATLPVLGPLFSQRSKDQDSGEILLVLRPRLVSPPPSSEDAPAFWVGSETRPLTPL